MSNASLKEMVGRRGELLGELFLQELQPEFVARAPSDFGYGFLIGFRNSKGGINNVAVEVKATEKVVGLEYPLQRREYERWAHSNIPILLLVIDVKENRYYYSMLSPEADRVSGDSGTIKIDLTEVTESSKRELLDKLTT